MARLTSATHCSSAHQERFDSLSSFYCRGARAAIICFDLTDRASFEIIQSKWIKKVADEAEQGCSLAILTIGCPLAILTTPRILARW